MTVVRKNVIVYTVAKRLTESSSDDSFARSRAVNFTGNDVSQDPFSQPPYVPHAPQRSRTWLYLLVILGIVFLFFTLLIVAGSLLALRHAGVIGGQDVPAAEGIESDKVAFVAGLGNQDDLTPAADEVRLWLESQASEYDGTLPSDVPFDHRLFMQAVLQSPEATAVNFASRLTLASWIEEHIPDILTEGNYKLVSVQRPIDPATKQPSDFAVANLYFYSSYPEFDQGFSIRWYLHKDAEGWKVYDFQDLDFGRRESDEWAHYLSNVISPFATGHDEVEAELNAIYNEGNAKELIRQQERRRVLPNDLSAKQLLVARAYHRNNADDDALRVLYALRDPNVQWGVAATKALVLRDMERYDEAIAAANELLAASPNHPEGLSTMCSILVQAQRENELHHYLARLLEVCPNHSRALERFVEIATPVDFDRIVRVTSANHQLESVLDGVFYSDRPLPSCLSNWRSRRDAYPQIDKSFWELVEIAERYSSGEKLQVAESLQRVASQYPDSSADSLLSYLLSTEMTNGQQSCDREAMLAVDRVGDSLKDLSLNLRLQLLSNKLAVGSSIQPVVSQILDELVPGDESNIGWWVMTNAIYTLLQYGHIDEAQRLLDRWMEVNTEEDIAFLTDGTQATVHLFRRDNDALFELLHRIGDDEVQEFLASNVVAEFLYANPDAASQVLSEFTPPSPYEDETDIVVNIVTVFNTAATQPDEAELRTWLDAVLPTPYELVQVNTERHEPKDPADATDATESTTWKVRVKSDAQTPELELLITIGTTRYHLDMVKNEEHKKLLESHTYSVQVGAIALSSNNYDRQTQDLFASQRIVWEIAHQSMTQSSIGVYADRWHRYWNLAGENLDAYRWEGTFPRRGEAIGTIYVDPVIDYMGWEEDKLTTLQDAFDNGETDVQLKIVAGMVTELVEVELLGVDDETENITVKLKQDSQLFPIYKTNQQIRSSVYEVKPSPSTP